MLSWMAWTWPTALVFIGIFSAIGVLIALEIRHPGGDLRKGVLGLETTRGDRLFIGLLSAAFIHLGVIGFTTLSIWIALALSAVWLLVLMRWG